MAPGFTQPLTEMSIAQPARKDDNLTAICVPIIWTMWYPRHLTTLQASTAF
jgi:hypothetical protein